MFKKKKKTLGFQPKQRTKPEVDREYQHHAILYGHNMRILTNMEAEMKRLGEENEKHLQKLLELNEEGMQLPVEVTPVKAEEPPTDGAA